MFSVVIPVFNKGEWILDAIDSVLNQTFQRWEIVIVDDGSTDDSILKVRHKYQDNRISIITQSNQGVSAARNLGIKNSKYDWIAFLDADDFWHPDYLLFQHQTIAVFPNVSIVAAAYKKVVSTYADTTFFEENYQAHVILDYFKSAVDDHIFWTSATVIHKRVFESTEPFDPELKTGEDLDLWFRTMIFHEGAYIANELAYYVQVHQNGNGLKSDPFRLAPFERSFVSKLLDNFRSYMYPGETRPGLRKFVYSLLLKYLSLYYFDSRFKRQAREVLKKVPLRYIFSDLRYCIYLLPYFVAKKIFFQVVVRRHQVV
jgi:glycosyltransferase involved in cell wall biosynthesis